VPKSLADTLSLRETPREVGRAQLIGGETPIFSAQLDGTASAGALRLENPELGILDLPLPAANLGSALLGGYVVDIDYDRSLVRFVATATAGETEAAPRLVRRPQGGKRRLGIAIAPGPPGPNGLPLVDGALPVGGVEAGSPAEAAGLRAGDRILTVNGIALEQLGMSALAGLFGGSDSLSIEVDRDGTEHTVTIDGS
jgi:membrane-associated protease RseP (regulator of RpoE activity)